MDNNTKNIIELNRDMEAALVQASYGRSIFFKDELRPLTFVHFADVHAVPEMWNRMVEYINYYDKYIDFAIHAGDYCGGNQSQYVDLYEECEKCVKPIYNCVGNHDTVGHPYVPMPKENAYNLLFNHTEGWDASFFNIPHSMTYYKDFPQSNIRMIVLDLYFDKEAQCVWLKDLLERSREEGMHVITVMHQMSDAITNGVDTPFNSIMDYSALFGRWPKSVFEDIIADFKDNGGIHICNLFGHEHRDYFGYTDRGVLNIAVECATSWNPWCDGRRVKGTKTYDAFNITSVDTVLGVLKLIRIGDNYDVYLRPRRTLCFDYINKKIVFTD